MYFLKALLKTSYKINLAISYGYLKYSALKITTSLHMQRYGYSLKMNVLFCFKAKKATNFSTWFLDL